MDAGNGRLSLLVSFFADNAAIFVLLLVLIFLSAYFSCSETTFSSASKIRLKSLADKGGKRAATALRLAERFDTTLTMVLCGNNLVNMATASVTTILALRLGIPETVMTLCITAIVILFGEVLPKTVAKARADKFALALAPSLDFTGTVLFPFAALFQAFSHMMTRVLTPRGQPQITEEDVHDIIEDIDEGGAVDSDEVNLLYSAFEFNEITVGDIYTSVYDVVGINTDDCDASEVLATFRSNLYSRMPVYRGSLDNIIGILRVRTFLEEYTLNGKSDIMQMLDTPMCVCPDMRADELLKIMQDGSTHMAIVAEDGHTLGIITIEDLLEELVGEIFDESDVVEDKFRELPNGSFEVASDLSVVSAFELIGYDDFDREECGHETLQSWAQTLSGSRLRRSQSVRYHNLTLTAGKTRHGRILSFYVRVPASESEVRA